MNFICKIIKSRETQAYQPSLYLELFILLFVTYSLKKANFSELLVLPYFMLNNATSKQQCLRISLSRYEKVHTELNRLFCYSVGSFKKTYSEMLT